MRSTLLAETDLESLGACARMGVTISAAAVSRGTESAKRWFGGCFGFMESIVVT